MARVGIKTRKVKEKEYIVKYGSVPEDQNTRLIRYMNNRGYSSQEIENICKRILDIRDNTEYRTIEFTVYEIPEASHRPRGVGTHFYVPNAKANHTAFKNFMDEFYDDGKIIITPSYFECKCFLPIPVSSMNKEEVILAEAGYIRPTKMDWDNLGKTYTDIMNMNMIIDDAIIVDGRVEKYFSFKPRVEVKLTYETRFNSKYIKNTIIKSKRYNDFLEYMDDVS